MSDTVRDRIMRYLMFAKSSTIASLTIAMATRDHEVVDHLLLEMGIVPRRDELAYAPVEHASDEIVDLRSVSVLILIDWSRSMSSRYEPYTSPLVPITIPMQTREQHLAYHVALQTTNTLVDNIDPDTTIAVVVTNANVTKLAYCGIASGMESLQHLGWIIAHHPMSEGEGTREALTRILDLCHPVRAIVITDGHKQCYAEQHAEYLATRVPRLEWYFADDPDERCLGLCAQTGFAGQIVA